MRRRGRSPRSAERASPKTLKSSRRRANLKSLVLVTTCAALICICWSSSTRRQKTSVAVSQVFDEDSADDGGRLPLTPDEKNDYIRLLRSWTSPSRPFKKSKVSECAWFRRPLNDEHVCCKYGASKFYRCLPSVVIIGSQKSGSTVLQTLISAHPQTSRPLKKETHFFDSHRNFPSPESDEYFSYMEKYLKTLPEIERKDVSRTISFEATPSYEATRDAMRRMSRYLPPNTLFISVTRNPLDRLVSELSMKRRRVYAISSLKKSVVEHSSKVKECALEYFRKVRDSSTTNDGGGGGGERKKSFVECLPQELSNHPKINILSTKWLQRSLNSPEWFAECFRDSEKYDVSCLDGIKGLKEKLPEDVETFLIDEANSIRTRCPLANPRVALPAPVSPRKPLSSKSLCAYLKTPPASKLTASAVDRFSSTGRRRIVRTFKTPNSTASPVDCDFKLRKACGEECSTDSCLIRCAATKWPHPIASEWKCEFPRLHLRFSNNSNDSFNDDVRLEEFCAGCLCGCVPRPKMMSDISKNFVWRGLTSLHHAHALDFIDRSRFFFLDSENLRNDKFSILTEVFSFIGVDSTKHIVDPISSKSQQELHMELERAFPNFESATGWSIETTDKFELSQNTIEELKRFYAEYGLPQQQQ